MKGSNARREPKSLAGQDFSADAKNVRFVWRGRLSTHYQVCTFARTQHF